ncbi:hypothetical protein HanIR_Chr16g0817071 [Helianthus annuus]|nr:hypothetical protein HanIR_Chr16g0817071 [Helianthus annuus]
MGLLNTQICSIALSQIPESWFTKRGLAGNVAASSSAMVVCRVGTGTKKNCSSSTSICVALILKLGVKVTLIFPLIYVFFQVEYYKNVWVQLCEPKIWLKSRRYLMLLLR